MNLESLCDERIKERLHGKRGLYLFSSQVFEDLLADNFSPRFFFTVWA